MTVAIVVFHFFVTHHQIVSCIRIHVCYYVALHSSAVVDKPIRNVYKDTHF